MKVVQRGLLETRTYRNEDFWKRGLLETRTSREKKIPSKDYIHQRRQPTTNTQTKEDREKGKRSSRTSSLPGKKDRNWQDQRGPKIQSEQESIPKGRGDTQTIEAKRTVLKIVSNCKIFRLESSRPDSRQRVKQVILDLFHGHKNFILKGRRRLNSKTGFEKKKREDHIYL